MKKKLLKFLGILGITLLAGGWFVIPTVAGSARDCDNNAVIYCGAYSTTELARKINGGTEGPHQSASELKALFAKYDIYTSDFGHLKNGRVTKDNKVYVDGQSSPVATNVYSMGRHKTANSRDVEGISYPLWLRHPSESFLSNSIDAYVYINYDGSMAYAVIKSCGNIVPGVGKRTPKYDLTIRKFNDMNGNGRRESNEPLLSGWSFRVRGNGLDRTVTTGSNGTVVVPDIKAGNITVDEIVRSGWVVTNGAHRSFNLNRNTEQWFGNRQQLGIQVVKFNDANGNRTQDGGESRLSGWQFRVTGNGVNRTITTNRDGVARLTGLFAGNYTVTEINQAGWENTTGLTVRRDVTTNPATQTFVFGNRRIQQQTVAINIIKFNDLNANKDEDSDESRLAGWQFRVTGNGVNQTLTTGADGTVSLSGLRPGTYTVTEINQNGWENTTGLVINRNVTVDPETQTFIFGNRKLTTPTPETPGGDITPAPLPVSGPAETAAAAFSLTSITGGAMAWIRSRKRLLESLKK